MAGHFHVGSEISQTDGWMFLLIRRSFLFLSKMFESGRIERCARNSLDELPASARR
jgi:hypothetical protein